LERPNTPASLKSQSPLSANHAVRHIGAIEYARPLFTLDIEDECVGILKAASELGVNIVVHLLSPDSEDD